MTNPTSTYSVSYWGSRPGTNDDCWTGFDFAALVEAEAFYLAQITDTYYAGCTPWVELDGPGIHKERRTGCSEQYAAHDADEWRREIAVEEGHLQGVEAYNEIMGYD